MSLLKPVIAETQSVVRDLQRPQNYQIPAQGRDDSPRVGKRGKA